MILFLFINKVTQYIAYKNKNNHNLGNLKTDLAMLVQFKQFSFAAPLGGALWVRDVLAVNGWKQMVNGGCMRSAA